MKTIRLGFLLGLILLVGCGGSSKSNLTAPSPVVSSVRAYNATASVGDFLTISIDPSAGTITYKNHTNGESGTVPLRH